MELGKNIAERKLIAGVLALSLGAGALAACSGGKEGDPAAADETAVETTVSTVSNDIPGSVEPGDNATVAAENAAGIYDCGGAIDANWSVEDNPYTSDLALIPHMEAHEELAESDYKFWTDLMGEDAFEFATANAKSNAQNEVEADIDSTPDSYETFLEKQVSTVVQEDTVVKNHACIDSEGNRYVRPVMYKNLTAGNTNVTGLVLEAEDYKTFVEKMKADGKDASKLLVQDVKVGDETYKHVATKHESCANNIYVEGPPTDTPETTVTTVPGTTVTTRPGTTTTIIRPPSTTIPDKRPQAPVPGGPSTTVERPVPGPSHPTTSTTARPPVVVPGEPNPTTTIAGNGTTTTMPAGEWIEQKGIKEKYDD